MTDANETLDETIKRLLDKRATKWNVDDNCDAQHSIHKLQEEIIKRDKIIDDARALLARAENIMERAVLLASTEETSQ